MPAMVGTGPQSIRTCMANPNPSFLNSIKSPKIKWQRLPGLKLQAYTDDVAPRGFERGLNESDMDPVQAWSDECHCGSRMSFNVWRFKNEKQITMFLIRWSE